MSPKGSRSPELNGRTSTNQRDPSPKSSDEGSASSTNAHVGRGQDQGESEDHDQESNGIDTTYAQSDEEPPDSKPMSPLPEDPLSPTSSSEIRAPSKIRSGKTDAPYSKPNISPPLQLTFGVEIECVLVYRRNWAFDNTSRRGIDEGHSSLLVVMDYVRKILRQASIPSTPHDTSNKTRGWTVGHDISVQAFEKRESSSKLPQGFDYVPLELVSPKLKYSPAALAHIREVLDLLKRSFDYANAQEENFQWYVNSTCGLHVHIGAQRRDGTALTNAGFPFRLVKNLYTFGAFFQNQIHEIFPAERVNASYARAITYTLRSRQEGVHGVASRVEEQADYTALLDTSRNRSRHRWYDRHVAYNVENLRGMDPRSDIKKGYRTVEFRQHQGTLDAEEICSWVRFVAGVVRLSHRAGEAGFPASFLKRSREEGFRFLNLLTALGMGELEEYYGRPGRLFKHPRGEMEGGRYDWEVDILSPTRSYQFE